MAMHWSRTDEEILKNFTLFLVIYLKNNLYLESSGIHFILSCFNLQSTATGKNGAIGLIAVTLVEEDPRKGEGSAIYPCTEANIAMITPPRVDRVMNNIVLVGKVSPTLHSPLQIYLHFTLLLSPTLSFPFPFYPLSLYIPIKLCITSKLVNGLESAWTTWDRCDVPCGNGTQGRTRHCEGPSYGGLACVKHMDERRECFVKHCPGYCVNWHANNNNNKIHCTPYSIRYSF